MKGKGFKQQDSCFNCKHCLFIHEFEESSSLFCHIDKSERPPSGSVAMDEQRKSYEKPEFQEFQDKWDEWYIPRAVNSSSICEEWQKSANR